jgi:condensin complex subunit 2
LELEFTVDPLFKKTSADFDEGGASGILMNHLGCDSGMKVVFDAGDAKLDEDEDDEVEEGDEDVEIGKVVDVGRLKGAHGYVLCVFGAVNADLALQTE